MKAAGRVRGGGVFADPRGVRVGEASRLLGLTPRAIRFYEERGLLRATRDMHDRRCFDPTARERLHWIALLRRAGVGLAQIRQVLETDIPDERRNGALAAVRERAQALERELGRIRDLIRAL